MGKTKIGVIAGSAALAIGLAFTGIQIATADSTPEPIVSITPTPTPTVSEAPTVAPTEPVQEVPAAEVPADIPAETPALEYAPQLGPFMGPDGEMIIPEIVDPPGPLGGPIPPPPSPQHMDPQ